MARTWLSVTVELIGGRGEELWPWPGRIFAVGPSHTFMDLADAINDAFGRWDRSHLSMFTLADGQVVTDESTGSEMAEGAAGPIRGIIEGDQAPLQFHFTVGYGKRSGLRRECTPRGVEIRESGPGKNLRNALGTASS